MIVKMIQNLRKIKEVQIEKLQEIFNKGLGDLQNKQTKMNSTIFEMKKHQIINSRIIEAEE